MKKTFCLLMVISIFLLPGCTIHFPFDYDYNQQDLKVVLKIDPDNAEILVNGRFIGEAYEFSTHEAALRLSSRDNEIVVKKKGYIEEDIDLYEFDFIKTNSGRYITINLALRKDKDLKVDKPEYTPKTVKEKEPPKEAELDESLIIKSKLVIVKLEVLPEESSIYINGKFWGIAPEKGQIENLRLKAGKYTIEVIKPGFKSYKKQVILTDQKSIKLSIKLIK